MGSVGTKSSNPDIITVIHYTKEENIQSIIENDFDFSRSGESAGDVWGSGAYYLEKGSYEDDMYSMRLYTESYIQSDIDTSDFLIVDTLRDSSYYSTKVMYDDAAKAFSKPIHREYTSAKRTMSNKDAFVSVAKRYYEGLIIKHRVRGGEYIDPVSGGNQIVVYNQSAIKNKKRGKNNG